MTGWKCETHIEPNAFTLILSKQVMCSRSLYGDGYIVGALDCKNDIAAYDISSRRNPADFLANLLVTDRVNDV